MYIDMKVFGFAMDSVAQMPIIILKDAEDCHAMPVWIQAVDAVALAAGLVARNTVQRSDLLATLLGQLGMVLDRLTIDDLQGAIYTSFAHFTGPNGAMAIPVSIADALGLSLRMQMPLQVMEDVLEKAATVDAGQVLSPLGDEESRYAELLERLNPSDLGKYPM